MPSPAKPAPTITTEAGFAWRLVAAFCGAAFLVAAFLAAALVATFLAGAFLAAVFLAVAFLAGAFFAPAFFAAAFFAAPLLAAVSSAFTSGWSATRLSLLFGVSSFIAVHCLKDRIKGRFYKG
ncbi:MAG TPA: hypothetical protein VFX91_11655 [Alcanivorax sp.]|nr:hypothetical protein [Alcanivorax sp.]